ncbi:MAG TPA: patatin-like phospholipase family protein [Flavisolibacter sp.]|nr:patatin-like phospholipase family protein [Flavisolibacter sp.]
MKLLSALCLFVSLCTNAQKDTIENIVFEGAGIRGIAYAGAIQELEQKGLLENIKRVGGTSAGAVTALLLSLNYTSEEIATIVTSTSFSNFNDGRFFLFGGVNRLQKWYGWYRGKRFENWLSALVAAKTGNADITFLALHQKGGKDLYVTGTSLNGQKLIVFSAETYPHMKVKDAVRISMSIPLYFEAVFIDSIGNVVTHPKNRNGLDVVLDGGFVANFPIKLFDSTKYIASFEPNRFTSNKRTLGFRIDGEAQIQNDSAQKGLTEMRVTNIKEYMTAFYTLVLENLNRQTLTEGDWKRTVSISDGAVGPRIRKLQPYEVERLMENGRAATEKYFKSGN